MAIYDALGNVLTQAYDENGNILNYAYDANGSMVYQRESGGHVYNYDDYTISNVFSLSGSNYQGFAIHDGIVAQFQADDKITLVSVTGETIAPQMYCRSYHGQSAFFTDDYYEQDDEFPLLVVMGSYTNQWVNRITRTGTTLIKTLFIPTTVEYGGYKLANAYDPSTKRMYTFGYTTSNYNSDEGGSNKLILATWDYSNLIDNGDDTYTPTLISVVQRDFVKCVQGSDYHDGLLWVTSTNGQRVYAFDPVTAEIKHTITFGGSEIEGCNWVNDEYLLVGQSPSNITYKKVTFAYNDKYTGKTLSILGDSISTYAGYIPSGNANFYKGSNCGVTSVDQTWWKRLIDYTGMTLNVNNSWSGSRVTTTNGSNSAGCMARSQNLGANPDVIIVYMGINDFNNEVALGSYDGTGSIPTSTTTFKEAYAVMLNKIRNAYPDAELFCFTLPVCERNGDVGDPEINDAGVYLSEYNDAIRLVANAFNANILDVANCGIIYSNMAEYMGDYVSATGKALHPNADGHHLIALKVINDIYK